MCTYQQCYFFSFFLLVSKNLNVGEAHEIIDSLFTAHLFWFQFNSTAFFNYVFHLRIVTLFHYLKWIPRQHQQTNNLIDGNYSMFDACIFWHISSWKFDCFIVFILNLNNSKYGKQIDFLSKDGKMREIKLWTIRVLNWSYESQISKRRFFIFQNKHFSMSMLAMS